VTTLDLSGGWSVREALGDSWQWYVDQPLTAPGWLPARVPGAVVADLRRAGELPDPYVGRNSRFAEWVSTRSWVYRRTFTAAPVRDGERAVLCLDGVDPGGTVFVDGVRVGSVGGLYRPARFDVTTLVADGGEHRLAVVVDPAPESEPQVGRTDRVRVHGPRMGYGWDFCPRLVHQGIWRGVRLEAGTALIDSLWVRPVVSDDLATATVHVSGRLHMMVGATASAAASVEVRIDGVVVAAGPVEVGADGVLRGAVEVPEPALWWPNGLGAQPLYEVVLRAGDVSQRVVTGFRHVAFTGNAGGPAGALPYTAVVNGRPVELTGWNWAPADALYGEITDAKLEHLVGLARRSGARLLRVWGGGLVETPEFYAACDRAGLFVWQEFSQSSSGMNSAPSDDPAFVAHLRAEANAVVPPRTYHPSLLMWGGGNELEDDAGPLAEERSPALAALREEVARLDPGRHWVPTSPTGPRFHFRPDDDGLHDVHGPWEHQGLTAHYTLYDRGTALAHTEFGVEGMANRRLWSALVPPADRWPVGRENPVYRHLGDWWNNAALVQECFGGRLTTPDEFRRASQFLQASGLAYAVEANRRRWPRTSVALPWQLAESYPNAWCTAVVDHAGEPKPAFHAVARAFAAERVTARLDRLAFDGGPVGVEAWLWSTPGRAPGGTVTARLLDAHGVVLAEERWPQADAVGAPRAAGRLVVETTPAAAVVLVELSWTDVDGTPIDRECLPVSTGADLTPLLDLEPAKIWFHVEHRGESVEVAHTGGPAVIGLQLSDDRSPESTGWAIVDGDPRPLLPGERRRYTVEWRHDTGPRRLLLESWNTEPADLELA
jgi:beta-mannosidase